MLKPQGYAVVVGDKKIERDMFTCHHCQRIVFIKPGAAPSDSGGWCGSCSKLICGPCADKGICVPFEKRLERQEARNRFLRSIGLA